MLGILSFLPDELKRQLLDELVNFMAGQAKNMIGDQLAEVIRKLSSEAAFCDAFDEAMEAAVQRFIAEYTTKDEDLVDAITANPNFWQSKSVRQALMTLISRPGSWLKDEREIVVQHFEDTLLQRVNRERVDHAVTFFLHCAAKELWTLPGAKEVLEAYKIQFQQISAETARQQVALLEAQLQATTQLSKDIRQALLQLTDAFEQKLLPVTSTQYILPPPRPRPYHNLPNPDYIQFVGRQKELDELRQCLSPNDQVWQIVVAGIGGVGKSALALAIAHNYWRRYNELPIEERFEAIIWASAKEEMLTAIGRADALVGLIFRTLDDIYRTIAQVLEREDITRSLPADQDQVVQKALSVQRTLLIVDNLESIADKRVKSFLRHLPRPTKVIITSRDWLDVAHVLTLTGLPEKEAKKMIAEEAKVRGLKLSASQRQQLFERTAGLPLPIKLSIARMGGRDTFEQTLRWLGDATGDLPEYCVKGQANRAHQDDSNTWPLLLACSLFDRKAGGSREALGYITDLSLADRDDGLTLLQRLSLLNCTENDHFWLLPIVQSYAEGELSKASDLNNSIRERWVEYFVKFTTDHGDDDLGDLGSGHKELLVDLNNIRLAIDWCFSNKPELAMQLIGKITTLLLDQGFWSERLQLCLRALEVAEQIGDNENIAGFLTRLGWSYLVQANYSQAKQAYDRAREVAERHNITYRLVQILRDSGRLEHEQGRFQEAFAFYQKSLELASVIQQETGISTGKYFWAKSLCSQGRYQEARQMLEEILPDLKKTQFWRNAVAALRLLGDIAITEGHYDDARHFLAEGIMINRKQYEAHEKYYLYWSLGRLEQTIGRPRQALVAYEQALAITRHLGVQKEIGELEKIVVELKQQVPA